MRIVDIIDAEYDLSATALFDVVLDLLPVGEIPPINQPAGPAGSWAIVPPGLSPVAIIEGEIFEVQIGEKWRRARMKSDGTAERVRIVGEHINRVPVALREGMRAGFFDGQVKFAKPLTE